MNVLVKLELKLTNFKAVELYSHEQLYVHKKLWRNIFNTIKTSGHSSLEKYIRLTLLKGLCVRVELETEQNCNILTPPSSFGHSSVSFSFSWFPQLDLEHWLQALNSNCLTSCLTRVISLIYAHSIQPVDSQGYPLISLTGCTCYLYSCISHLTAWSGRRSICNSSPALAFMPWGLPCLIGLKPALYILAP